MNIFVILIMGVMLATYQYFTTKRSSDVVLNKDELRLQAELTCMKQYHDFAASRNEAEKAEVISFKGTAVGQANYTCTGADTINSQKYCINSVGAKIDCSDTVNVKEHCVSTTKWKTFSNEDKYLITQILKSGVSIISNGKIKNKHVQLDPAPEQEQNKTNTAIGLISCIDAEKLSLQNKMLGTECEEGTYAVQKENGTIVCEAIADISPCTSHETEVSSAKYDNCSASSSGLCCTQLISGRYCCPNAPIECPAGKSPVWKPTLRFWMCSSGEEYCTENGTMLVQDDNGNPISTQTIENAFTPQYDESLKTFVCNPKADLFTTKCKEQISSDYAFLGVENLSKSIAYTNINQAGNTPICRLSAKSNSKAVENCSVCEEVVFDTLNNQWKCQAKTWNDIKGNSALIDKLRGTVSSTYNAKGLKGCFSGCDESMIAAIKQGKRNGPYWGLRYDSNTRMWTCFTCQKGDTFNNQCNCDKKNKKVECLESACTNQTSQGKCSPYECSTEYQVQIDGECYTKWCNRSILPENAEVNLPTVNSCPETASWMVYNEQRTCVYCIRPPVERVE